MRNVDADYSMLQRISIFELLLIKSIAPTHQIIRIPYFWLNYILNFDIAHSNLIVWCFVFKWMIYVYIN